METKITIQGIANTNFVWNRIVYKKGETVKIVCKSKQEALALQKVVTTRLGSSQGAINSRI